VEEDPDRSASRFFYDRGVLELVRPSFGHEQIARVIASLVEELAVELDIDVVGAGSTTFKREDLARGFEPDASFYFSQNAAKVRGKRRISLDAGDPPPDLVVEADITSPSASKLPIYASLGVAEVWRHDGDRLAILALRRDGEGEHYAEIPESARQGIWRGAHALCRRRFDFGTTRLDAQGAGVGARTASNLLEAKAPTLPGSRLSRPGSCAEASGRTARSME